MRLYLSSFRMGSHPERLVELAGGGGRVAIIANAMDAEPQRARDAGVARERAALAALGFDPTEVDLRLVDPDGARAALAPFDVVWLRGGNVFVLRHALAVSGADRALVELLAEDAVVGAGYSAGPCVLGPSLRGFESVDPVDELRRAHRAEPTWDGLGVIDRVVVPHVQTPEHPASPALDALAARHRNDGIDHVPLRDGQVLVVDGGREELLG